MSRPLAYLWASFTTVPALLLFVPLARLTGGSWHVHSGVIEVHGGLVRWLLRHATLLPHGASALTLGHVVLGVDAASLTRTRRHERVHVAQYERWGPLFIPAYALCSLVLFLRRRDAYFENPFERQVYAVDDGSGSGRGRPC